MYTSHRRAGQHTSTRAGRAAALAVLALSAGAPAAFAQGAGLELRQGDTVVLLGNTLAERLQHFNHFETLLMTRFPELRLRVRNMGWSGDTITLQPRPLKFGTTREHLQARKADVILAFFGLNESFDGEAGLPRFERDLEDYLETHATARYNGRTAPRVALISPIAHERLPHLTEVDVDARNRELERYTAAMRRAAARRSVAFVDLFTPTRELMSRGTAAAAPLTINGIHLNEHGDAIVGRLLMQALGFEPKIVREASGAALTQLEALRDVVREKNQQFFYRWRPLNAEYVVGRRVDPFGSVSFPPEMQKLDQMVSDLDQRIWKRAAALKGVTYPLPANGAGTAAAKERN